MPALPAVLARAAGRLPRILLRSSSQSATKGQIYRDFGAGDWFFEIEETSAADLWSRLKAIHDEPAAARAKIGTIMAGIEARQRHMVEAVRAAVLHESNQ